VRVERVTEDGIDEAAAVMAAGFDGYAWTAHTVAADDHRERLRRSFEAWLRHVDVPGGTAWWTEDHLAVALWIPPEPTVPLSVELDDAVREAAGDRWPASVAAEAALTPHRPRAGWVLGSLATHPDAQGQGRGSVLLAHGLAQVDADGESAWLETCGEANVRLYGRFGFEVTATTPLDGGPVVHTMVRPTQAVR
jgi:GNAT superfamily N-acetyltransferase